MSSGATRGGPGDGTRGDAPAGARPADDHGEVETAAAGRRPAFAGLRPRAGIKLVALDLDGVVYRGGMVLPGAREALEDVVRRGLDLRYVSNNSTAHRETVSERLTGMGLPAGADRVLTSGFVAGRWLRARLPRGPR